MCLEQTKLDDQIYAIFNYLQDDLELLDPDKDDYDYPVFKEWFMADMDNIFEDNIFVGVEKVDTWLIFKVGENQHGEKILTNVKTEYRYSEEEVIDVDLRSLQCHMEWAITQACRNEKCMEELDNELNGLNN